MSSDPALQIYVIESNRGKVVLFASADAVEFFETQSDDRIRRLIAWLGEHRSRLLSWLGRTFNTGRGYYVRLEARLDPVERVLKAMDSAQRYIVFYSLERDHNSARRSVFSLLRRQRRKHLSWFALDFTLSVASLAIAFLPGPNILGWYPFLRSLSHYRAFHGAGRFLHSSSVEFKGLPELRSLEENLRMSGFDRATTHTIAESLKLKGLEQFLERIM